MMVEKVTLVKRSDIMYISLRASSNRRFVELSSVLYVAN